ncbi:hypothetical protein [Planktomarina sp.]|jgi:hypothetical protein|uniref:hypothetical protein n=1 Tax=Planktomarina sp. TaxID=2024851 RepID=UPI0032604772
MIVIIQCAGSKVEGAATLRAGDGRAVRFVAQPELAASDGALYARPDDDSGDGVSWREKLLVYNQADGANPLGLLPASRLYKPPIYSSLAAALPASELFVLSAGWGLIRSDFLTPAYDITFSTQAKPINLRKKSARYDDFCALDLNDDQPVVFFGGKDYLPLFCALTWGYRGERSVFYNAQIPPEAPGCRVQRFNTKRKTNWHYECAEVFLRGDLCLR